MLRLLFSESCDGIDILDTLNFLHRLLSLVFYLLKRFAHEEALVSRTSKCVEESVP